MKKIETLSLVFVLIGTVAFTGCQPNTETKKKGFESAPELIKNEQTAGLEIPDGFEATVFAEELGRARHITVRENGDVYVALRELNNGNGIAALRDTDGDHKADSIAYFGDLPGTGIDIRDNYLYFAPDTAVMRYQFNGDELVPSGEPEIIVGNFPLERQHAVKPFTFDDSGNMYVNVGAPSNACMEQMRTKGSPGMDPCPILEEYGGIWKFKADQSGQKKNGSENRYATGIRNAVALDWNHNAGSLYALQHGRDQLKSFFPDMYNEKQSAELPAEEFFKVEEGTDIGWPYAYYDHQKGKKVLMPEYGGDGEKIGRAVNFDEPLIGFPGHWAPNDLLFYTGNLLPAAYKNGAFIAFHGSWNRAPLPQKGYKVVFVPFDNDVPAEDYFTFARGFKGTDSLRTPGNAEYRPMGLAQDEDGALMITDSQKGRVWRVAPAGN